MPMLICKILVRSKYLFDTLSRKNSPKLSLDAWIKYETSTMAGLKGHFMYLGRASPHTRLKDIELLPFRAACLFVPGGIVQGMHQAYSKCLLRIDLY